MGCVDAEFRLGRAEGWGGRAGTRGERVEFVVGDGFVGHGEQVDLAKVVHMRSRDGKKQV